MPKKAKEVVEKNVEKTEGLSPFGELYEMPDVNLSKFINQTTLKEFKEKLGKDVLIISLGFSFPDSKESVVLLGDPNSGKKTVMLATNKALADSFYNTLKTISEKVT
jgi:hypothetical protein